VADWGNKLCGNLARLDRAQDLGSIPAGRHVGTHTLRRSAARHWSQRCAYNPVSQWLGHTSIQTTLVYLEILPNPSRYMDRVP